MKVTAGQATFNPDNNGQDRKHKTEDNLTVLQGKKSAATMAKGGKTIQSFAWWTEEQVKFAEKWRTVELF